MLLVDSLVILRMPFFRQPYFTLSEPRNPLLSHSAAAKTQEVDPDVGWDRFASGDVANS